MYQAKDAGRNTDPLLHQRPEFPARRKRLEVESKLRKAIENEEFFLRYQPQVDIASGRISGMEALIRWNDPEKGEVFPKDFIFVAEELGLIVPLGEWVFRTACRQLQARGRTDGLPRDHRVDQHLAAPVHVAPPRLDAARDRARDRRRPAPHRARDHRDHDHAQPRAVDRDARRSCAASACRSPWTTSASATRRSASSRGCRLRA